VRDLSDLCVQKSKLPQYIRVIYEFKCENVLVHHQSIK